MILITAWMLASGLVACISTRTPQHYLLPEGFSGWAYVKYDDPACLPLDVRDGRQVVAIPASGRLCTSTHYETGTAQDLWEYVRPDGTTKALNHDVEVSLEAFHEPGHFESFLVGAAHGATPDPSPFH